MNIEAPIFKPIFGVGQAERCVCIVADLHEMIIVNQDIHIPHKRSRPWVYQNI
jgi:hypothetical protein